MLVVSFLGILASSNQIGSVTPSQPGVFDPRKQPLLDYIKIQKREGATGIIQLTFMGTTAEGEVAAIQPRVEFQPVGKEFDLLRVAGRLNDEHGFAWSCVTGLATDSDIIIRHSFAVSLASGGKYNLVVAPRGMSVQQLEAPGEGTAIFIAIHCDEATATNKETKYSLWRGKTKQLRVCGATGDQDLIEKDYQLRRKVDDQVWLKLSADLAAVYSDFRLSDVLEKKEPDLTIDQFRAITVMRVDPAKNP